jgi:hypothetical protein
MKQTALFLVVAFVAAPLALIAQSSVSTPAFVSAESSSNESGAGIVSSSVNNPTVHTEPFSRMAIGTGASPMGVRLQVATNLNDHFNLRGYGSMFNYNLSFTTSGIDATAKLDLASGGAALDVYPFRSGFRISPGALFYNQNRINASANVASGTSFTLNNQTFYSANANSATGTTPVTGNALLNLHASRPAFTITTGWGNMIPRDGGHWSFPFEIGAAFIGDPALNVNLAGWVCEDPALTQCANLQSTNPIAVAAQTNLQAQVAKWNTDLNPLKTYPIISGGIAYSFRIRSARQ